MIIKNPDKQYYSNNTTVYSCQYHVIFTPKYRRPVLTGMIQKRLKELFVIKANELNLNIIEMEIMVDHVHLLIEIPPDISIKQAIGKLKGYSSRILRKEFPELTRRLPTLWTRSMFVSTVGAVSLSVVKKYIEDQKGK